MSVRQCQTSDTQKHVTDTQKHVRYSQRHVSDTREMLVDDTGTFKINTETR